jgi:hypothetical protein
LQSRLPEVIQKASGDVPGVAAFVNQAQQQLLFAMGESGPWGGWQKVAFHASRCHPYITLPRIFARAIGLDVCRFPIRIQNEFYEFLEAGVGLQGDGEMRQFYQGQQWRRGDWCGALEGFDRGTHPTWRELDPQNQQIQVVATNPEDYGKRVLIGPCKDQNGNYIYTQDGNHQVKGFYLTLGSAIASSGFEVSCIEGVQKDLTAGDVLLYQLDVTTGNQALLSRYAPDEITPSYRRYYINRMPCGCFCHVPGNPCLNNFPPDHRVPVTALCKMEHVPVVNRTDFLVVGNIPALIEECMSIRYASMDSEAGAKLAQVHHLAAISLLNKELDHYLGRLQPAVNYAPWGTARLQRPLRAVRWG